MKNDRDGCGHISNGYDDDHGDLVDGLGRQNILISSRSA